MLRKSLAVAVASLLALVAVPAGAGRRPSPSCDGKRATIVGTRKGERLRGTQGTDVIVAKGGNDRIDGRGGGDTICGGKGSDAVNGNRGADRLFAQGGPDRLEGGPGNDLLDGGANSDPAVYFGANGPIEASLVTGSATGAGRDTLRNIDELFGSPFDDHFVGDDTPFNALLGLDGDDTLEGNGGNDFIAGNNGDDTLDGGEGEGFDFLDHIYSNVDFEQGLDPVTVNFAEGTVVGQGSDTISNFEGSTGTPGDDTFVGDNRDNEFTQMFEGEDQVDAGPGDDLIDGGDGTDDLDGGPGTDTLGHLDHSEGVTVDLEAGTSTSDATDTITGFENVWGSFEDDVLSGDAGANEIFGFPGDDDLNGLAGNDVIAGDQLLSAAPHDEFPDTIDGGEGNDVCVQADSEENCESDEVPQGFARLRLGGYASAGTTRSGLLVR